MDILEKIIQHKKDELLLLKNKTSIKQLKYYRHYNKIVPSFYSHLIAANSNGIIAEFKRRSPSKGVINGKAAVDDIIPGYTDSGVACISILTDTVFFGGNNDDLMRGRDLSQLPLLRKDFIIDSYQIYEAKAIGASAILLIAAILDKEQLKEFAALANALGMEVLLEIHDEKELGHINSYIQMVGINNRNLRNFEVDIQLSLQLASQLPSGILAVAESGISSVDDYLMLRQAGFRGFLIGEQFMKQPDPVLTCKDFCESIRMRETN